MGDNNFIAYTYVLSAINHMFGRVIWDKLPECIFKNFENFQFLISKIKMVIYPKYFPCQTYGYWLITPNQKTLCFKTNVF